ncbi:uroporphyrinogen decarboxylase [Alicyclobacillus sp. ALC3]|uniref:uroporphyrinogen decarboxylase n=1 Tax=Alicyclobacillus sp. ALC3 TaxID=2796143 RepID=UPI0023786270|nr:uroporphyrinogen decarboxylase [Alicyclobacillus sp. ALC3]WDL96202.1 uroporphyrinogen decarboxylase [Alicyclobacillus sp. ALC3]
MLENTRFLDACWRRPVDRLPVWYMRQAGRYQPEYRKIRERYSLLDIVRHPEVCKEVTMLPVEQLNVDAAILFSDIMVPVGPLGVQFDIKEAVGPVIESPIRSQSDVDRLHLYDPVAELPYVFDTIQMLHRDLKVPLIGFTGGPFTLASYLVEGGPSRNYVRTKQLMWSEPDVWQSLMDKLADMTISYLTAQIDAGARAVQLFDSWVGSLAPEDFETFVLPVIQRVFAALEPHGVPLIYSGVVTGELLPLIAKTGATVVSIDWRVPIESARARLGSNIAIQGNLDPAMLFAPWSAILPRARAIVDAGLAAPGFIFNLGHGVVHNNPPIETAILRQLTDFVHAYSSECIAQSVAKF